MWLGLPTLKSCSRFRVSALTSQDDVELARAMDVLRLPDLYDEPTKFDALKTVARTLPPDVQVVVAASMTMGRAIGRREAHELAQRTVIQQYGTLVALL